MFSQTLDKLETSQLEFLHLPNQQQSTLGPTTELIKLTNSQRNTLRRKVIPTIIYGCVPIGMLIGILYFIYTNQQTHYEKLLFTIMIVVLFGIPVGFSVAMFKNAIGLFKDAREGIALQQIDVLKNKHLTRKNHSTFYYGKFQNLGNIDLDREQYVAGIISDSYRVTYSPRSKYIWNIEDLSSILKKHQ